MFAYKLPEKKWFCTECENFSDQAPTEVEGYDVPYSGFYDLEDIGNHACTLIRCSDDCDVDDGSVDLIDVWVCGKCEEWFGDSDDAANCCS